MMILVLIVCYWNFALSSPFISLHLFVPCLVRHLTRNCFYACVFVSLTLFVRFLSYLWYTILISIFYDVLSSTLVFYHIHLVITNLSVQLCKVPWKSFHALLASCSTLFVGHDFAIRATCLVSSLWSLFVFLYALLVLYCLAGALCGCVRYTPFVIYFHTGAFMLMSDD